MHRFKTPEQALAQIVRELREDVLCHKLYEEVVPAGSVPLGTYVDIPDLDIFILCKSNKMERIFQALKDKWGFGYKKVGELTIWFVPQLYGYDVDFVIVDSENPRVQTLEHVKYYTGMMTDDFKKRIMVLKKYFMDINCYGAETGGITGICCTRLAELHPTSDDALKAVLMDLVKDFDVWVEDPTLRGRDLFASVTGLKKRIMIREINRYFHTMQPRNVDLSFFFNMYDNIVRIERSKKMGGTDREFQFVYTSVKKTWNEMKNKLKYWKPMLNYDILFTPWDIYVGYTVTPRMIEHPAYEYIVMDNLPKESIINLLKMGAIQTANGKELCYQRDPPMRDISKHYTVNLFSRLTKKYRSVTKA